MVSEMTKHCYLYNPNFDIVIAFDSLHEARRFENCHVGWRRMYGVDAKHTMCKHIAYACNHLVPYRFTASSLFGNFSTDDIINRYRGMFIYDIVDACENSYREGLANE